MNNPDTRALLPVTLKPCPFCGFDSQCLTTVTAGAGWFNALQCQSCGATGPYNLNQTVKGDGPTRWNTRHQSETGVALTSNGGREALDKAIAPFLDDVRRFGDGLCELPYEWVENLRNAALAQPVEAGEDGT